MMIDKDHLRGKGVLFRIRGLDRVYAGLVKSVENDGFWIEAPDLLAEAKTYSPPGVLEQIRTPILFVPTAALLFLVAAAE